MSSGVRKVGAAIAIVVGTALLAGPAYAAGFSIFEHGSKSMGMAGAFTAQADDGSAMFHNAAGLAFQHERSFMTGFTYITSSSGTFKGAAPFPGSAAKGELKPLQAFPAHAYFVQPIHDTLTFGFGFNDPFGLVTEWKDKASFSGRYLSTKAALRTFDLNPTIGWQVTPRIGLGFGLIGRASDVVLERYVPFVNPFTNKVIDIATVHLASDLNWGYGWNIGLLHRYNESFSWGLSYRSKIKIDYTGDATFKQILSGNAALDGLIGTKLPFAAPTPIETSVEYPDSASLGFAFAINPAMAFEVDVNWTGWSSFDELSLNFTQAPALSSVIPEGWKNCYSYRLGFRWSTSESTQWRFGYVYDETPQPEEAVGPMLPDSNRNGITIGYGHKGARFGTDIAFMYLPFDERTVGVSRDRFYGTYNNTAYLLGMSLSF